MVWRDSVWPDRCYIVQIFKAEPIMLCGFGGNCFEYCESCAIEERFSHGLNG